MKDEITSILDFIPTKKISSFLTLSRYFFFFFAFPKCLYTAFEHLLVNNNNSNNDNNNRGILKILLGLRSHERTNKRRERNTQLSRDNDTKNKFQLFSES